MVPDIKRTFKIAFQGERALEKILIGVALMVVAAVAAQIHQVGGLVNLLIASFSLGYCVRLIRQETTAAPGAQPVSLPEWNNFGVLFKDGILLLLAKLIYGIGLAVAFLVINLVMGSMALLSQTALQQMAAGDVSQVPVLVVFVWIAFAIALVIFSALFIPLMVAHYAHENRFSACFEVGRIFGKLTGNFGAVVLAILNLLLVGLAVILLSLTIILQPVAAFLGQIFAAHIWAQVYRGNQSN